MITTRLRWRPLLKVNFATPCIPWCKLQLKSWNVFECTLSISSNWLLLIVAFALSLGCLYFSMVTVMTLSKANILYGFTQTFKFFALWNFIAFYINTGQSIKSFQIKPFSMTISNAIFILKGHQKALDAQKRLSNDWVKTI